MKNLQRWDANRVSQEPAMLPHEKGSYVLMDDYVKLKEENERLCRAGDAFLGTYLFASVKGLVDKDKAIKVFEEWTDAKEGKESK